MRMEAKDELKAHIVANAIRSFPKGFLENLQKRAETAYVDTFEQIRHDPTVLPEQRIHKLKYDRCFRMDNELAQAAKAFGLPFTAKPLAENNWHYVYATVGEFGITQSYVQKIGDLPAPAKFRERLADAANIPRFPLDDDPEIFKPRQFYGLFTHNPVGQVFSYDMQKLGSLRLCVPYKGMKGWALEIPVVELTSLYPADMKVAVATPAPTWKKDEKRRASGDS